MPKNEDRVSVRFLLEQDLKSSVLQMPHNEAERTLLERLRKEKEEREIVLL